MACEVGSSTTGWVFKDNTLRWTGEVVGLVDGWTAATCSTSLRTDVRSPIPGVLGMETSTAVAGLDVVQDCLHRVMIG